MPAKVGPSTKAVWARRPPSRPHQPASVFAALCVAAFAKNAGLALVVMT